MTFALSQEAKAVALQQNIATLPKSVIYKTRTFSQDVISIMAKPTYIVK
jgi:hypothetical protein